MTSSNTTTSTLISKTSIIFVSLALFTAFGAAASAGADFSDYSSTSDTNADIIVSDSDNLQDEINGADPGATILVEPGSYSGTIDVTTSDLTIVAEQRPGGDNPSTVMGAKTGFRVTATGVTVKGFEVTANPSTLSPNARGIDVQASDVTVDSNYVHNVRAEDRPIGIFIWGDESDVNNVKVIDNRVEDVQATVIEGTDKGESKVRGIALDGDSDGAGPQYTAEGVEIMHNTVLELGGNGEAAMASGVHIYGGVPKDFKVKYNKISKVDHNEDTTLFDDGPRHPVAQAVYISGLDKVDSVDAPGNDHEVSYNEFLLSDDATADIQYGYDSNTHINAPKNFYDGEPRIWASDGSSIDYTPWLAKEVGESPQTYMTDDNINEAVDAATDGDTVRVEDGVYSEWVPIDKSITLESKNPQGAVVEGTLTARASDVIVEGFEVTSGYEGITVEPENGATSGIVIRHNYIHGLKNAGGEDTKEAFGIIAWATNTELKDLVIHDNVIENVGSDANDAQGFGMFIEDIAGDSPGVVIQDNTVRNIHSATIDGYNYPGVGIGILPELTNPENSVDNTGKIISNTANAEVTGNQFAANLVDLSVAGDVSQLTVSSNQFNGHIGVLTQGSVPSTGTIGVTELGNAESVISNGPVDANNNYWGDQTGPTRQVPGQSDTTVGEGAMIVGDVDWAPFFPTKQAMNNGNSFNSHQDYLNSFDSNTNTQRSNDEIRGIAEDVASDVPTMTSGEVESIVQGQTEGFVTESDVQNLEDELDSRDDTIQDQQDTIEAQEERIDELESEMETMESRLNDTIEVMESQGQAEVENTPTGLAVSEPTGNGGGIGGLFSGLFG